MPGGTTLFTDSNNPGQDRIVYKVTGTDPATGLPQNFAYCGAITHTGAVGNGFVPCW